MLTPAVHRRRREDLLRRVPGPILLLGNGNRARNLPGYGVPFRQCSTFLYFTGCALPDAAALIEESGTTLFLPEPAHDDALWHGNVTTLAEWRERFGVEAVVARESLDARVPSGTRTLAVPDEAINALGTAWTGTPLRFGVDHGDEALVDAVIAMRRAKSAVEVAEMLRAAEHSRVAHEAVIKATRPGGSERALAALFEGVLAARGCTLGYQTILTQRGEVLHNHDHDGVLKAGRLLLNDAGGEVDTGYGVDITRTWPVSGRFDARQRSAYDAVLEANRVAVALCTVGRRYREVHDAASRVLATWLRDEGLLRCDADTSVETGAHAVFFPHGVGHLLGMDVHDLEAYGDRPAYPRGQGRPPLFGTRYLRLDLPLEAGWIVTIEPGFYVVPAILDDRALRDRLAAHVDFDKARGWLGFGGIRIEDDILVTEGAPEVLTDVPRDADAIEALVGTGPSAEGLLFLR